MANNQKTDFDPIDHQILRMIQKNPAITHTEIAQELERSQPTIGARIKKMEAKSGMRPIIVMSYNVLREKLGAIGAIVLFRLTKSFEIVQYLSKCPYVAEIALTQNGCLCEAKFIAASLKTIYNVINGAIRCNIVSNHAKVEFHPFSEQGKGPLLRARFDIFEENFHCDHECGSDYKCGENDPKTN